MSRHRPRVERGLYRDGSTFYACATPAGSRTARWKSLGAVGVMEARRLRDECVAQVRQGQLPSVVRRASFETVAAAWLDAQRAPVEVGELAPRPLDGYELSVRRHLLPFFLLAADRIDHRQRPRRVARRSAPQRRRSMVDQGPLERPARRPERAGERVRLKTSGARRNVIVIASLARTLRHHRLASPHSRPGDPVFATTSATSMSARNAGRAFAGPVTDAGLTDITLHALRHTYASMLIAQGRDPVYVADQLGHTTPSSPCAPTPTSSAPPSRKPERATNSKPPTAPSCAGNDLRGGLCQGRYSAVKSAYCLKLV